MRAAEDVQLEVVLPHCPQDLGDALAVDGPSGQVAEMNQVGKSLKEDLERVDCQLGCLVDVEALQGALGTIL